MDLIGLYKKMVLSLVPENLEKQLKTDKGTLGDGIKNVALASLVVAVFVLLAMLLQFAMLGATAGMSGEYGAMAGIGGGFLVTAIIMLILIPVGMVIFTLINTALSYIWCKILGGKGTYTDQYYQFSIVGSGLLIATSVLNLVPFVGSLVAGLLGLYYLYPVYLVYKGVHKLSSGRAIIAVILPLVLAIILVVMLVGYLVASLASLMSVPSYS